jgi:hypothetical protein
MAPSREGSSPVNLEVATGQSPALRVCFRLVGAPIPRTETGVAVGTFDPRTSLGGSR